MANNRHIRSTFVRGVVVVLTVFLLAGVLFAQTTQGFLGSWTLEDKTEMVWTFRPDGTGFMERSVPRSTARYTWSLRGDILSLTTTATEVSYSVIEQSSATLILKSHHSGKTYRLVRPTGR